MNSLRSATAVLFCLPLLTLAACGQDDTTSTAAPATASAAPAASSAPAATTPSSPAAAPAGPASKADKALCTTVEKAGQTMKTEAITALSGGANPDPVDFKKILGTFAGKLTRAAATADDSQVTTAVKAMSTQAAQAAAQANPIDAAADPKFEEAGSQVTTACAAAGVKVNF